MKEAKGPKKDEKAPTAELEQKIAGAYRGLAAGAR
jgi:hypothetical protein